MEVVEKEIIHDDHKDYASKCTANTGLGFGIAGTALGLLALGGKGLFGLGNWGAGQIAYDMATNSNLQYVERKACQNYIDLTKEFYQGQISNLMGLTQTFYNLDTKVNESSFALYKNQRDQYDVLADRIGKLETAAAVNAAVEPWRSKVTQMEIANVVGMIGLEAERRSCADNKIVSYVNSEFYPVNIANVTVGTTSTAKAIYNPLCPCTPYVSSAATTSSAGGAA